MYSNMYLHSFQNCVKKYCVCMTSSKFVLILTMDRKLHNEIEIRVDCAAFSKNVHVCISFPWQI